MPSSESSRKGSKTANSRTNACLDSRSRKDKQSLLQRLLYKKLSRAMTYSRAASQNFKYRVGTIQFDNQYQKIRYGIPAFGIRPKKTDYDDDDEDKYDEPINPRRERSISPIKRYK